MTVLDDRPDFADQQRFPGCEVIAEDFIPALRRIPLNGATFIVIITRGHEHDTECLTEIIPHETAYIGLIGSRRRVSFVLELLAQKGIPAQRLADVCTPIGIPIGAESPEEIALSIAAELVCVRRKGVGQAKALSTASEEQRMTDKNIFEQLADFQKQGIPVCLATIVNAAGSTPREIGAKMIISADGKTWGSVGGGCGENQVRSAALRCLLTEKKPALIEADLTDDLGTRGGRCVRREDVDIRGTLLLMMNAHEYC